MNSWKRSKCKIKTLNPEFNETWILNKIPCDSEVLISLWDKDFGKMDDSLGSAKF